jgi:hypothetical protein
VIQRNSLLLLLFCGLVVAACTKTVQPGPPAQVASAATAQESAVPPGSLLVVDPKKKVVCRTFTPTGTRFQRRVCLTQADWDEMQQEDREYGEAAQRKGVQTGNPSEPCKPNCGD